MSRPSTDVGNERDPDIERRLEEAEHTLEAIQSGQVDAVVVHGPRGPQIYSLEGPDQPFRTFVEAMSEGAITLSADGTIRYANRFFAELLGRKPSEVIGTSLADLLSPGFRFTLDWLLQQGLERPTKATLRLETRGEPVPVQLTLSPLETSEPSCCGVVFDLREREQIEHANAAREAAEQASAAKDQFLAVLSHELRSPLSTILGWAQLLGMRTDLDDKAKHAIQTIERNARAQSRLIAELLDVSRFIAGKLHLENEVVDLKQIVSAALAAARMTSEKDITIGGTLDEADCYVFGDATRLQQVVTNLLHNACKFTESGGSVDVGLTRSGAEIVLTVRDTGSGIAPDQLTRVFELFRQGDEGVKQRKGGLGLGLAITKQLVEAHGGKVTAESEGVGKGATFTVRLPRADAPASERVTPVGRTGLLEDVRVLLIDDELDLLDLTRHVLEGEGARVRSVQSAAAALAALENEPFDVLLSDIGLPEQDGLALMREIRARGHTKERLPAIALTGFAGKEHARLAGAAGYQLHLAKPVDTRELVAAVAQLTRPAES